MWRAALSSSDPARSRDGAPDETRIAGGPGGLWAVVDALTAAAQAEWSPEALDGLLATVGQIVEARRGALWMPGAEVHWRGGVDRDVEGEHLLEFCGVLDDGSLVMLLWECEGPVTGVEDLVEGVGRLLVHALQHGIDPRESAVPDWRAELRTAAVRMHLSDLRVLQQAAGMLAARFGSSIIESERRLSVTAQRFQISPSGFARQLLVSARHEP